MSTQIYIICTITFLDLLAIGLTVPLLSNHIRDIGGSHLFVGVVTSLYSGLQLLSAPVVGSWSDVRGRKSILIISLLLSGLCYFIIGLTTSLLCFFCTRIVLGFMKHTQTLCKVVIADVIPKEQQTAVYGYTTAISMAGFVVGPLIGGHLSETSDGFFYVCTLTAGLFIINAGLTYLIPNINRKQPGTVHIYKEMRKAVSDLSKIEWLPFWDVFSMKFFHAYSGSIFFSYFSLIMKENYNVSQREIGYVISFQSLVSVISALLASWIKKTFYKTDTENSKRHYHLFAMFTFSFILLYSAQSIWYFMLALIPFAMSNALLRIIQTDIVISRSHKNDKGSLSGSSSSISSLARLTAPLSSGLISNSWGLNSVMCLAFVPAFIGTVIAGKLNATKSKH